MFYNSCSAFVHGTSYTEYLSRKKYLLTNWHINMYTVYDCALLGIEIITMGERFEYIH